MPKNDRVREMIAESSRAVADMADSMAQGIGLAAAMLIEAFAAGRSVLVCGNGGSAADAQHIAGELAGHFRRDRRALPCIAISTDTSVMTAIANDYSYETVFARQVEALGRRGDVLWAISTSGNSANVLAAARAARERGMKVLGMTGQGGGKLGELADVCLQVPLKRTDLVQLCHQAAYHILCEFIDETFVGK